MSGEEKDGPYGGSGEEKAECLQKIVADYLPREEGVSQRIA